MKSRPLVSERMLLAVSVGLLCSSLVGCRSYRFGSLMHPQFQSIAVGTFKNLTDEPGLGPRVRGSLMAQFSGDGSLRVTDPARADVVLQGKITRYVVRRLAAAKVRPENARDSDRDAYQTTIYRVEVEAEYDLLMPGRREPLQSERTVVGRADFSRLPDLDTPRRHAIEQALGEMATEIVHGVSEGW